MRQDNRRTCKNNVNGSFNSEENMKMVCTSQLLRNCIICRELSKIKNNKGIKKILVNYSKFNIFIKYQINFEDIFFFILFIFLNIILNEQNKLV